MLKKVAIALIICVVLLSVSFNSSSPGTVQARELADEMPDNVFFDARPIGDSIDTSAIPQGGDYTTMVVRMEPVGFTGPLPEGMLIARGMVMVGSREGIQYGFPMKWENVTGVPALEGGAFSYSTGFVMHPDLDGRPPKVMYIPPDANVDVNDTGGIVFHGSVVFWPHSMLPGFNATVNEYDNSISQGDTNWHQSDVTDYDTTLKVDLKWKTLENKLRLLIYTPDGKILGPYYDDSDGTLDGRINLEVTNKDGVAIGQWVYKINGIEVAGKEDYYIKTG